MSTPTSMRKGKKCTCPCNRGTVTEFGKEPTCISCGKATTNQLLKPTNLVDTPPAKEESWVKEFDEKFTRKNKGYPDHGKYMNGWFIRETTAKQLKQFISSLRSQAYEEGKREAIEEENKRRALEAVTYGHIVDSGNVTLKEMAQKVRGEAIEEVKHKAIEYGIDKRFIHELEVLKERNSTL